MKKLYYLGAMAGLILTSCANDDLVNPLDQTSVPNDGAIAFNMRLNNQTRAGLETVMDNFGVFAIKSNAGALENLDLNLGTENMSNQVVMNNYCVKYLPGVEYYGSHWSYLPEQWASNDDNLTQYLKYWDGSYTNTFFIAYGPFNKTNPTLTIGTNPVLTFPNFVMNKDAAGTGTDNVVVYADMQKENNEAHVTASASNTTTMPQTVPLTFRYGTSKVKIAFHENIPGYKVEMHSLTFDDPTDTEDHGIVAIPATKTGAAWGEGQYVNEGQAVVTYVNTTPTLSYTKCKATSDILDFELPDGNIGVAEHNTKVYSPTVYNVIPNSTTVDLAMNAGERVTNSGLQFVMNYTLKSEDTKETIEVKNARVYVTPEYTAWAPNTVYTYVFLITRNSSGTTTGDDPKPTPEDPEDALYPIIFDEVVITDLATEEESEWYVNGLQLNQTQVRLQLGSEFTLTSSLNGADCPNVTWEITSGDDVVAFNETTGKVTTKGKVGKATIKATAKDSAGVDYTATCTIEVVGTVAIKDVPTVALTVDQTAQLGTDITGYTDAATVTWASEKTSVATVDSTGKVTAVAADTDPVKITVTVTENGVTSTDYCWVKVE